MHLVVSDFLYFSIFSDDYKYGHLFTGEILYKKVAFAILTFLIKKGFYFYLYSTENLTPS